MLLVVLIGASAVCALLPAVLFCINLRRFRAPSAVRPEQRFPVSVLIPARNEEANIGDALRCVLSSVKVDLEVLVWNDASTDRTGDIVQALATADARVRLLEGTGLPLGWNGKQHACWRLAEASVKDLLVFLDADVRVEPELLARMANYREGTNSGLVSGFPRLVTVTWLERLLLPLIHFVLLAFLPMRSMRQRLWPSAAAGCGQFLLLERGAYFASGGHSAIRETMHDGLLLPRVLRRAGFKTDIADITELASVRMYDSAAKVWQGLAKNATEGIATPGKIVPLSLILFLGQVVPALSSLFLLATAFVLFVLHYLGPGILALFLRPRSPTLVTIFLIAHGAFLVQHSRTALLLAVLLVAALFCSYLPRLLAVRRFGQSLGSALLHPVGVLLLLCVQWYALGRKLFGKPVGWRQRTYSSDSGAELS